MQFVLKCIFLASLSFLTQACSSPDNPDNLVQVNPDNLVQVNPDNPALLRSELTRLGAYYKHRLYYPRAPADSSTVILSLPENLGKREASIKAIQEEECRIRVEAYSCFRNDPRLECHQNFLKNTTSMIDTFRDNGHLEIEIWPFHLFSSPQFPKTEKEIEQVEEWGLVKQDFLDCENGEGDIAQCIIKALGSFINVTKEDVPTCSI